MFCLGRAFCEVCLTWVSSQVIFTLGLLAPRGAKQRQEQTEGRISASVPSYAGLWRSRSCGVKPCLNRKWNKGKEGVKSHGQILMLKIFTSGSESRALWIWLLLKFWFFFFFEVPLYPCQTCSLTSNQLGLCCLMLTKASSCQVGRVWLENLLPVRKQVLRTP